MGRQPYWLRPRAGSTVSRASPPQVSKSWSGANKSRSPREGPPSKVRKPRASLVCNLGAADIIRRISRGIRRGWRHRKLRRDIAVKHRRSDVIETAFEIGPDLAADIGPASAEREILAEIGSAFRVDHALEQCEAIGISGERVVRMLAEELQRGVVRVRAHSFQHMAAD